MAEDQNDLTSNETAAPAMDLDRADGRSTGVHQSIGTGVPGEGVEHPADGTMSPPISNDPATVQHVETGETSTGVLPASWADDEKPDVDAEPAGNSAAVHGDHDRVAMLSLRADGTPDQLNPEFIGDPESTLAATREQFAQQAVSAADSAAVRNDRAVSEVVQDPTVSKLTEVHEQARDAANAAAERAVEDLTR